MNYIINVTEGSIKLSIDIEFAKAYFGVLYNANMQGAFNNPDPEIAGRMSRFIEKVALELGLVQQKPEMEARPDPPPIQPQQQVFVNFNGQPMPGGQ